MLVASVGIILFIGIFIVCSIIADLSELADLSEVDVNVIEEELKNNESITMVVFILPLLLIIFTIVALFLFLINSKSSRSVNSMTKEIDGIKKNITSLKTKIAKECNLPTIIGNYHFSGIYNIDNAIEKARTYRDVGYRVKLRNFLGENNVRVTGDEICGVYVSDWPKDEEVDKGEPKWMDN